MQVVEISDAKAARAYYETRYAAGYMDRWERERRSRLLDVLREVELPAGARILDYGCGSGALTGVLAERWPDAEVIGADISPTAVEHARARRPSIRFEVLDAEFVRRHLDGFDFVFSHHVLEHVFDLSAAVAELVAMTAPSGQMLHALPCGNPGSLAHWLCQKRPDGIDEAAGNRFYFEEASHLRRLRSHELEELFAAQGAHATGAAFGYHGYGALRLFTEMTPRDISALLDPRACHRGGMPVVAMLLAGFMLLAALRAPLQVLVRTRRMLQQVFVFGTRRLGEPSCVCLMLLSLPAILLLPLSAPVEAATRWADRREWRTRRRDPRGSEMFLQFEREPAPAPEPSETGRNSGKPAAGFPQCSATPT